MAKKRSRRQIPRRGASQPGGMGMGGLGMIQKLQEEVLKAQEALESETVTVTAGGGAVEVVITGHQHLQSIRIDPDVVDPEDVEMLQDLILAAVNEAIEQSKAMAAQKMESLTGGLGLPSLKDLGLG